MNERLAPWINLGFTTAGIVLTAFVMYSWMLDREAARRSELVATQHQFEEYIQSHKCDGPFPAAQR